MPWQGFTANPSTRKASSTHHDMASTFPRGGVGSDLQLLKMQEVFKDDLLSLPSFQSQSTQLNSSIWRVSSALSTAGDTQMM